jgi:hypothetical protein
MLPQSAVDYDIQLQRDVFDLDMMTTQLAYDVCFIYCEANVPSPADEDKVVSPRRIYVDLVKDGFRW